MKVASLQDGHNTTVAGRLNITGPKNACIRKAKKIIFKASAGDDPWGRVAVSKKKLAHSPPCDCEIKLEGLYSDRGMHPLKQ